jgi:hypothetical protein
MPDIEIPSLKSLFIEMYFEETLLSTGTATLLSNDKESHCTLITNRHNVTGRNQDTGKCLSKYAAVPDNIVIHFHTNSDEVGEWKKIKLPLYREDGSPYWIEHPRLGEKADIVALNLTWGDDVRKVPYYLKLDLDRVDMVVGPAETVSVIGFPFGLSTSGKLPIWATGFMAQEISLITPDDPVFLIDCRSRQGQSGSPVIAYRTTGYRHVKDGKVVATMTATKKWEFMGIYSGRINPESDLGKVWHVSALEELLDAATTDAVNREKKRAEEAESQENV